MNGEATCAIARLEPGDPLYLVHENGHWKILDHGGIQVGRMARKWSPPAGMAIDRAVVQVGEGLGRAEALGIARDLRLGSRMADWWLPQLQPAGR